MGEIDYIRERESGAGEQQGAAEKYAAGKAGDAPRKWPLGISLLIAAIVSLILWGGIFVFAMRLWRWW
jgi:hypothetical protein